MSMNPSQIERAIRRFSRRQSTVRLLRQADPSWKWLWAEDHEETDGEELYYACREVRHTFHSAVENTSDVMRSCLVLDARVKRKGDQIDMIWFNGRLFSNRLGFDYEYKVGPGVNPIACDSTSETDPESIVACIDGLVEALRDRWHQDMRRWVDTQTQHAEAALQLFDGPPPE